MNIASGAFRFLFRTASIILCALASVANGQSVLEIDLPIYNIVFSSQTGLLYATVGSAAGAPYGNSLIEISPDTGKIKRHVFVGSEPDPLVISQDGSLAWIGLDGAGRVQAVNISALTLGTDFNLGFSDFGTLIAGAITVMPGAPQTVAVSLINTQVEPSFYATSIFDNGVARPNSVTSFSGPVTIAFGAEPTVLYGFDNEDTGFDFFRMSVDGTGVSINSDVPDFFNGFSTKIITDGDTVFTTSGVAADGTTLTWLGTYEIDDYHAPVALDPATRSVQFASNLKIYIFDRETYLPTFTADLSSQVHGEFPAPSSAANCGPSCMAVAYNTGQLLIVHDLVDTIFADGFEIGP